jgi:type III secretion protein C
LKLDKKPSMLFVAFAAALPVPFAASAQTPPAQNANQISIVAREQPIAAFLRELFGKVGRPVVPSAKLTGTVNGVFQGTVEKIYGDIAKAFSLISYYDGAAIYVYAPIELGVQNLALGSAAAERIARQARAQRLPDRRNLLRVTTDGLVVSGTPRFIEQVSAMARGEGGLADGAPAAPGGAYPGGGGRGGYYDAPRGPTSQPIEFRVFYLRYARAEDTLVTAGGRETRVPGLASILQNLVLDQKPGGSAIVPSLGARLVRQSQPRLKGQGLDGVSPDASQAGNYAATDVLGGGDGGMGLAAPLTQDVVRIEPSAYLNAIVVRDVPERMAAYDSLIRALDVEPQIVEIEATIIDINVDKLQRLGINWRFGSGGFGALFGSGNADADTRLFPIPGSSRRNNVSNITPSGQGGTISTIIGSQREFLGRITALENKGAARIVSRPQIMTLSNVEAVFDRTRTFYVKVAGREEVDLFNVTAGTVMRVNPHVFRDHDQTRIRVLVNIEDGSISPDSMVENIPVVDRASVATQGMVVDGESLLLGGMTIDAETNDETKVPLLGDIPLLGELFKFRNKSRGHTERLFLITPRLVPLASRAVPAAAAPMPAGAPPAKIHVPASGATPQ